MVDIDAAVRYPTRKKNWTSTIAAGGSILFGSQGLALLGSALSVVFMLVLAPLVQPLIAIAALVLALPVFGYYVDVIRSTIDDESEPPAFANIRDRLKDGLVLVGLGIVYLIPLVGIVAVSMFVAWILSTAANDGALFVLLGPLLAVPLGGIYAIVMVYVLPISVSIYAEDGLSALTALDRYRSVGTDRAYAGRLLVALVALFIGGLMAQWLVLFVIGFFVAFYAQIVAARQIGLGYATAREGTDDTGSESTDDESDDPSESSEAGDGSPTDDATGA